MLGSFTSTGTDPLHSFSFDDTGAVSDSDPFSMTIWAQATMTSGAVLLNRGQGEVKLGHSGAFDLGDDGAWFRRTWLCRISQVADPTDNFDRLTRTGVDI